MARVIEDLGHCGRASKPVGLRVYEPGSLPDPGQCAQALIAINDRSDGVPRARLAMSNGASWDIVAVTSDLQSQQTVDVQPHVHKAVAEATSQWAQRMAAAAPLTQTGMETEATLARHADEVAGTSAAFTVPVKPPVSTVAGLPSAATAGAGARAHVSDALAPTFGATVANGGAVSTPVYSDGTNWKVG